MRGSEKLYRKTYVQYEEREGRPFVHPVAPKRPTITLASLKADLERTYNELQQAQESYQLNKNVPETREADLRSAILVLEQQLANRRAELDAVIVEGSVAQQASKAISKAERATSALASHTVDASAAADAKTTFYPKP